MILIKRMENFWVKLKKPLQFDSGRAIYALAPMAGYTDSAFRQICKNFGADVVYSEMAAAAALAYCPDKTLEMLKFSLGERPYVVQLFGSQPDDFGQAAKLLSGKIKKPLASGVPDGIDINFGCPVKKVAKQGAGAVLMNNKKQAREIIKAVINNTDLPVSIKVRARVGQTDVLRFLDYLRGLDIKAVMIHGRTLKQGFAGPVDSAIIKKARNYYGGIILANGGVNDYNIAVKLLADSGADGLGIARGALGRPWIFKALRTGQSAARSARPVCQAALKHAELAWKLKGSPGIVEMRKHLCWYVQGLPGAKKIRERLVRVENIDDIKKTINSLKK